MSKGKNNIIEALNNLDKPDIYSLILFALYKLKGVPEYSTLSELCYVLDGDNLINFLDYYGGSTIKVPTKQEFKSIVDALLLYEKLNTSEDMGYNKAIKELNLSNTIELKRNYQMISELVVNYDFQQKQF